MSDTIVNVGTQPQVNPETALAPTILIDQAKKDAALAAQVLALAQKKDYLSIAKLGIENRNLIEQQVKEVEDAIPLIKSGWKTTEFWVVVLYGAFNIFCIVKGISIPPTDDITLGGLVASYVAGRHYVKGKQ